MKELYRIRYRNSDGRKYRRKFSTKSGLKRFVECNNLYGNFVLTIGTINESGIVKFDVLGVPKSPESLDRCLSL